MGRGRSAGVPALHNNHGLIKSRCYRRRIEELLPFDQSGGRQLGALVAHLDGAELLCGALRANPMSDRRTIVSEKRGHVLFSQPPTSNLVAVTPGTTSYQGVGQRSHG